MADFNERQMGLLSQALSMYANWVETRNPILSAEDVSRREGKVRFLDPESRGLADELRDLKVRVDSAGFRLNNARAE